MTPPKPHTARFLYTHKGVQELIRFLMDSLGIGQFELSKRSGLSPATIFQILNKTEKQVQRPPRPSTLTSLAKVIGADLHIDSGKKTFSLTQRMPIPESASRELGLLLSEIGNVILSGGRALGKEERERIVKVVKAIVG